MTNDDLTRLREKLTWLRTLDRSGRASSPSSLASFGASQHRHELAPPISPEALADFEATLGLRLPEDYRAFLSCLGNGGAGPFYGLAPLGRWDTEAEPITDEALDDDALEAWYERALPTRVADLRRDFVLDGPFYSLELDLAEKIRRHHFPPHGAHRFDGCVLLCDVGCGESCFLVVRGPRAGEVWIDQSQAAWPIRRVSRTFLAWYEHHLDLTLGNALANMIRRCLVLGEPLASDVLGVVGPIVEASAARTSTPNAHSHEDLERDDARSALAFLRLVQGRVDEAEGVSPLYVALVSNSVDEALAWIDQRPTPYAELLAIRARLLRRLGRDGDALAAWDAAMVSAPFDPDLPRHKAALELELGDPTRAEATLLRMARAHQKDREDALESAEWVAEFAAVIEGPSAPRFEALAAQLRAEAEALPDG